ncbi:putative reverse transcriptase domain-containing protein [Tanacetum coccineum]
MTITRSGMSPEAIEELINQRVAEALAEQEANRNPGRIVRSENQYGDEEGYRNSGENGNGNGGGNKKGNGGGNGNYGNGNRNGMNGGVRGNALIARVCTYKDFLNCQPRNFSGTEGVVGLARWFEKMESMYRITNYPPNAQVKFDTCTLLDGGLTWWNAHVQTVGINEVYQMSWTDLMKLMIKVYCPRNEIQKLENELWNLSVKRTDVDSYTCRFQELTLMCQRMVPEEEDKIESNYKKVGHMAKDCKATVAATTQGDPVVQQRTVTCFEYGRQGQFKKDCPKLKN